MSETFQHVDDGEVVNDVNDVDDVDNTETTPDVDTSDYKYTNIDCLDEDPEIPNQKFGLFSFVSPEGIMNCKVRGFKCRGVYATQQEAMTACENLKKKDKYHDIFVGPIGKWLPLNPSTTQAEKVKYRNAKLDKIMAKVHESDLKDLNELVGRRKDILDKEKVSHKNRVKESIRDSVNSVKESETVDDTPRVKKTSRDADAVRDRLKKTLAARQANKAKLT